MQIVIDIPDGKEHDYLPLIALVMDMHSGRMKEASEINEDIAKHYCSVGLINCDVNSPG